MRFSCPLLVVCAFTLPLLLSGCGTSSAGGGGTSGQTLQLSGNWQIQTAAGTAPSSGILLLGALTGNRTQVSGTFRLADLNQSIACGPLSQVITVSGSVDASNTLTLTSAPFSGSSILKVQLAIPQLATTFSTGTIEIDGTTCSAASAPALGVLFAPLSGTYNASVLPGTIGNQASSGGGSATLTMAQAVSPTSDGQFPLTATLTLNIGSCSVTRSLSGDASGVVSNLAGFSSSQLDDLNVVSTELPAGTQLPAVEIFFLSAPCAGTAGISTTYSGTFIRQ